MTKILRTAFLGAGYMAEKHGKNLLGLKDIKISAIPVFVEKPIALDTGRAKSMKEGFISAQAR